MVYNIPGSMREIGKRNRKVVSKQLVGLLIVISNATVSYVIRLIKNAIILAQGGTSVELTLQMSNIKIMHQ